MPPESAKFLQDMLDAALAIESYAGGKSETHFLADRALRDAVQWNFCVIGEALSQLRRQDEATADRISETPKIIGLRNQLIHGYGVIDSRITWNIIVEKLPTFVAEVRALLGS
jgi:uncharacterized protein with HEPN domain